VIFLIVQTISSIPLRFAGEVDRPTVFVIWSLILALNIYVTSMIVYRIWIVDKESPKFGHKSTPQGHVPLLFIMCIVIESALINTCATIFVFFANIFNSNVGYTTSLNSPVLGISFNLILIRLAWYPYVETEEQSILSLRHDVTAGGTDSQDQESTHIALASLNESDGAAVDGQIRSDGSSQTSMSEG